MNQFETVKHEAVKFLRGKYCLNEAAGKCGDSDCIEFQQGRETIVSVILHRDFVEFLIMLGKEEQKKFESQKSRFPKIIQEIYDKESSLTDEKWLRIGVEDINTLEGIKELIMIKKEPDREPISKENAKTGRCGHRCDLCVHYTGNTDEFREKVIPHLTSVYGNTDWSMRCTGCNTAGCYCQGDGQKLCYPLECMGKAGLHSCFDCTQYPCEQATVGYEKLEHKDISADDVTWAILPYVPYQYECN